MTEQAEKKTVEFPWERAALYGEALPEGLNLEEQLAFLSLRHLAAAFRLKMVSQEQAAEEKRKILGEYQRREEAEAFRRQVDAYHVKLTQATERAKAACLKDPTPENLRRLVRIMDGIERPAESEKEVETNGKRMDCPAN